VNSSANVGREAVQPSTGVRPSVIRGDMPSATNRWQVSRRGRYVSAAASDNNPCRAVTVHALAHREYASARQTKMCRLFNVMFSRPGEV